MTPHILITTLKDKYSLLSHFIDIVVSNISVTNMSQQGSYHNYKKLRGFKLIILKFEICKTSTRYPTVDYDIMSLINEIVEELSQFDMEFPSQFMLTRLQPI